jgi:predicted nucleic acid-binding protein
VAVFAIDTSCVIAAVCEWHEEHHAALTEIERRLDDGERMAVPAHVLAESYAVLTRLPAPNRLSPGDASQLIDENFAKSALVVALSAKTYAAVLRKAVAQAVAGGRIYDALIGECARQAGAEALLTFNRRHFEPPPSGIRVIDPSTDAQG